MFLNDRLLICPSLVRNCCVFWGATENAGVENAGVAKMQWSKSREWKSRYQNAGVEIAGVEMGLLPMLAKDT